ncbi:MAG: Lrp/AsnC family transcriptional regulator [Clostridia bacterium]|nr:Lrp/AsnC family transcriptional regulator [Clostridia bacterium]
MNLLEFLEKDSRLTEKELAAMCEKEEGDIRTLIDKYERSGIILGYKTVIDWDKAGREYVDALIELKVVPQRDYGFDELAGRISNYPEVKDVFLMSGGFDIAVMLEGKTMREVALFVAEKLAVMDSVTSTSTHFVLRKYKSDGIVYKAPKEDERGNCN